MRRILQLVFIFTMGLIAASAQSDQEMQSDQEILTSIHKALHAYSLDNIHASVQSGFVTLTGTVDLCDARVLADRILSGVPGITTIWDRVQVSGPTVPDQQLKMQVNRLISERSRKLGGRYGFINARVQDGVVTLTGSATILLAYPTVETVAAVPGVKNVVDHVHRIAPIPNTWANTEIAMRIRQR